jgi:nucleoside-diphosphate-sugar epimerase
MDTALVTGSAGFIGGHLTDELLKRGYKVVGIDNMSKGLQSTMDSHIENENFVPALYDITTKNVERVFYHHRPKYVFHLAAQPGVAPSMESPVLSDFTNTNGTVLMLKLSQGYGAERFIFSSSSSIYGGSDGSPNLESDTPNPKSPYALQKLVGEQYCRLYAAQMGLDTACLRYFNVIGPRQRADSAYAAVLPAFSVCKKKNIRPTIYGDGLTSRDFCSVESVVSANILAAEYGEKLNGEVFNVARGQSMSLLHLCEILDLRPPKFEDERQGDVKHSLASIDKIKDILGYEPVKNIEEKILETAYSY